MKLSVSAIITPGGLPQYGTFGMTDPVYIASVSWGRIVTNLDTVYGSFHTFSRINVTKSESAAPWNTG